LEFKVCSFKLVEHYELETITGDSTLKTLKTLLVVAIALTLGACTNKSSVKKLLEDNPDILVSAIDKHPKEIMDALNAAVRKAQQSEFEDRQKSQDKERDEEFKSPKTPIIDQARLWGNKDAPITIVEYSDFQCPFCKRGFATLEEVRKKYGDKVKVQYKNMPLDFHPMAMPAAKYFEAVVLQGIDKAEKFHNYVFEHQDQLEGKKEKFLDEAVKKAGADIAKVKKDLDSEAVKKSIDAQIEEARKFGFNGTPGFLVNGVSIRGAYPAEEFTKIIDKIEKK
jgi:protein-disulfide isomerase